MVKLTLATLSDDSMRPIVISMLTKQAYIIVAQRAGLQMMSSVGLHVVILHLKRLIPQPLQMKTAFPNLTMFR